MKPFTITKEQIIARMWEIASIPPEQTRGTLKGQIDACQALHELGYAPAVSKLGEIAHLDTSRTRGRETGQKAATKFLTKLVASMKPETSGIQ
jgi:hypothetical protein